jgi:hypothetical protein
MGVDTVNLHHPTGSGSAARSTLPLAVMGMPPPCTRTTAAGTKYEGPTDISCYVIKRKRSLSHRFSTYTQSYDVASNIRQCLPCRAAGGRGARTAACEPALKA